MNTSLRRPVVEARGILRRAIDLYKPVAVYGLFSGGGDSTNAVHLAAQEPEFTAAVTIVTGIGIDEAVQHSRDVARQQGWPHKEMHPPPFIPPAAKRNPRIDYENLPAYDALVLHYGFPGPAGHRIMYNRLKQRCLEQLVRESKRGKKDRVLLVGGMRLEESTRRMGNAEEMSRQGCTCWVAPIIYWTDADKNAYMEAHGLYKSEVSKNLCMSGECCCGAFAEMPDSEELWQIKKYYPAMHQRIEALQEQAKALGVHDRWGTRPPKQEVPGNFPLFSMCWSCNAKAQPA